MKQLHLDTRKRRGYFLAIVLGLVTMLGFSSCLKDDDPDEVPVSFITFVHSLPQYQSLDFYVGGIRSTSALLFTENSGRYLQNPPYLGYYSGTYPFQVGIGGTLQQILGVTGTLEPYKNYTFFVATSTAAADTVVPVVLEDNMTAPANGKAKVRFVNLVRNTSSYDLAVQGGTALFANKAYRASNDFVEVDEGTYIYELRDAGTTTVRTSSSVTLAGGKIYTIWSSGGSASTSSAVDPALNVIVHK